jgi:hypothetical protein
MELTILHIFRAFQMKDGKQSTRGTLTVCESKDFVRWVYFDHVENGEPWRSTTAHADMACYGTDDDKLVPEELPEVERDLGRVSYVVFGLRQGTAGLTLGHLALLPVCFKLYGRLPTPPPGVTIRTVVVPVRATPRALV